VKEHNLTQTTLFLYPFPFPLSLLQLLHSHCVSKHPTLEPAVCFPSLAGFDPNAVEVATAAPVARKVVKKKEVGLDDLLSAGLSKGKK
jgi:hypothetical protein